MTTQTILSLDGAPPRVNLVGKRFGRLTVVRYLGRRKTEPVWECKCDCGGSSSPTLSNLRTGGSTSCGCKAREKTVRRCTTHGMANSPEFLIWQGMKKRCFLKTNKSYQRYGGAGISVCERWRDCFENFYADMGPRPSPKHSVDRIDNNKGYEPGNCRWAISAVQNRNRSDNVNLTYEGKTQCLQDWANELGVPRGTLASRYKARLSIDEILTRTRRRASPKTS